MLASVAHLGLTSGAIKPAGKGCNNATGCTEQEFCYKVGVDPGLLSNDLGKLTSLNYTVSVIKSKLSGEGSKVGVCGPKKGSTTTCEPALANLFDGSGAIAAWATDQNGAASLSNVCSDGYYCSVTNINAKTGAGTAAACHKLPAYHEACAVADLFKAPAGAWTTSLEPLCGIGLKCSTDDTTSKAKACDSQNENTSATCGTCVVCAASADCTTSNYNTCYKVNIDPKVDSGDVSSFNYTTAALPSAQPGVSGICGPTTTASTCETDVPTLFGSGNVLTNACKASEYCAVDGSTGTGTCTKLPDIGEPCAAPEQFKTPDTLSIDPFCADGLFCNMNKADCKPSNGVCGTCAACTASADCSGNNVCYKVNIDKSLKTSKVTSFNYTTATLDTAQPGVSGICGPVANTNTKQSCEPKAPILLGTTKDVLTGVCQPTEYCAVNVAGKTGTCAPLPGIGEPCAAPDQFIAAGDVYQPSIDPICAAHTVCTVGAKDCQPVQNAFCGTCTSTTTTTQASSTQASSTTNTSGATTTSIAASFVMMLMTFIL